MMGVNLDVLPVDLIRQQREGILAGKWVKSSPRTDDEYCLVARGCKRAYAIYVDYSTAQFIENARNELFPGHRHIPITIWNDRYAKSVNDVLDVLERAEKLAWMEEENSEAI